MCLQTSWTRESFNQTVEIGKAFVERVKQQTGKPPASGTVRCWLDRIGAEIPSEERLTNAEAVTLSKAKLGLGMDVNVSTLM
jgi:hypothetical protein